MFLTLASRVSAPPSFPRIRGDVPTGVQQLVGLWEVFPAYAGMFLLLVRLKLANFSFPRIRGDVPDTAMPDSTADLFSPHTRGCSQRFKSICDAVHVFPAYAGMFLWSSVSYEALACFPRIRGDVPFEFLDCDFFSGFSPHTRGCSRGKACNEEDSSEII